MKTKILSLILVFAMAFSMMAILSSCGEEPETGCEHTSDGQYVKLDANQHLSTCSKCGASLKEAHVWVAGEEVEKDGQIVVPYTCVCGATKEDKTDDAWTKEMKSLYNAIDWNNAQLIMQMNLHSQNKELESGCYNYLAGANESTTSASLIKNIRKRNADAMAAAHLGSQVAGLNVQELKDKDPENTEGKTANYEGYATNKDIGILYKYTSWAWKAARPEINKEVLEGTVDVSDIYVNQLFDMVGCSLEAAFQNVLRKDVPNYFGFTYDNYNVEENERGYMQKYVSTLGFSPKIQYLIASDYFIDVIRAFFTTTINMNLFTAKCTETIGDVNNDGEIDVYDLSELIQNGGWTWDLIAKLIAAVSVADSATGEFTATGDGINGFATPSSSKLVAAGITYCNDVRILTRTTDETTGEYVYTFATKCEPFYDYAQIINDTIGKTNGAVSVSKSGNLADTEVTTNLFASDKILITVNLLGTIEATEFQNMWNNGEGFFIAPMPKPNKEASYTTVIHNMGRLGAISAKSTKFSQASAFLNYVSVNSAEIVESFYNNTISKGATLGSAANLPILKNLRDQIHIDDVTKAVDDAWSLVIGQKVGDTGDARFHSLMYSIGYKKGREIATTYESVVGQKQTDIAKLVSMYKQETPAE